MAWLQCDPSGNLHVNFRFGGRKYKRSLKTKDRTEAETRVTRLEETLRLVESGRIDVPETADVPVFLLSDGKLHARPTTNDSLGLAELFDCYFDRIPHGSLEQTTIRGMKSHQRHLERHLGKRFRVKHLSREDLERYVTKRSQENGIRGRKISPATIKKELVTFRTVWNWAKGKNLLLCPDFPLKGVRFPKSDEKPRFQTLDEIEHQRRSYDLNEYQVAELWDCLFLTKSEIEELLDHVEENAAHPFIYPMVVAAAHSGARRSELMRSRLLDFDSTHFTIREMKRVRGQRSMRRVPMSRRLKDAIRQWKAIHPGGKHTFCLSTIPRSRSNRESPQQLTRDEANDHLKRTLSGGRWKVVRGWHCFRHSFCSNCAMQGIDQRVIDSWVGHTTEAMRRRYRHLYPNHERQLINSVFS